MNTYARKPHWALEYSGLLDPNYQKSGLSISTLCPCTRSQAMVRIFGQLYVKRSGHRFSAWDVHFKWLSKMPKKPMPCLRSARRVEQYWGTLSTVPRQYEGSEKARRVWSCPVPAGWYSSKMLSRLKWTHRRLMWLLFRQVNGILRKPWSRSSNP